MFFLCLVLVRPLGSTRVNSSAASDVSERQGVSFTMLAAGPGEPLGGGGRYDELLGRFGLEAPAPGLALDVGNGGASYIHLRAHETVPDLGCRLSLEINTLFPYSACVHL